MEQFTKLVLQKSRPITQLGEAEDTLAALQSIAGYKYGYILPHGHIHVVYSFWDIQGAPITGQHEVFVPNSTYQTDDFAIELFEAVNKVAERFSIIQPFLSITLKFKEVITRLSLHK